MLKEILIQNFVIAKNILISLEDGFNVFTGETGAGKTLLMNAILFGLGHSIHKEAMGEEKSRPYVRLTFTKIPKSVYNTIQNEGYECDTDDCLILERTFSSQGKNRSRINGQVCTLQFFKEIGNELIDFHGQRETGSLLIPKKQLEYLDKYIGKEARVSRHQIHTLRNQLVSLVNERTTLQQKEKAMAQEAELLQFQLHEIETAQIEPQEWELLQEERNRLENHTELIQEMQNSLRSLSEEDDHQETARNLLQKSIKALSMIASFSKVAAENLQTLETVDSVLNDASHELHQELSTLESNYDSARLEQCLERIDVLQTIRSRYGTSYEEIQKTYQQKKDRFEDIEKQTHDIDSLCERENEIRNLLTKECSFLHQLRVQASQNLARDIENNLHQLSMPNALFALHFSSQIASENDTAYILFENEKVKVDDTGLDHISFHFQPNPDLSLMPINKIASGGELSRIMLAIKATLKKNDQENVVYIFDEIDTGINGVTGNKVGTKLKSLSILSQTLCITHLPQIASCGDSHYYIEKSTESSSTISSVNKLNTQDRVKEIARMMGGDINSPTAIEHAKEMVLHASKSAPN
ncbi:MAG: DNA repair protein RecN [Caldisericia bacterium]|nr:DNA repair protein RecN [Caldisericia bacterium]MDD4614283.1 DNA repair protein RecN [Caldisericia bacterium]